MMMVEVANWLLVACVSGKVIKLLSASGYNRKGEILARPSCPSVLLFHHVTYDFLGVGIKKLANIKLCVDHV
jgi:hypothetical protein